MAEQSIFVICEQTVTDDNQRRDWITEEVDPDHGYFGDRSSAQSFVDELDAPALAAYAERKAAYDEKVALWDQKQARAAAQSFANPDWRPSGPPDKPLPHLVIEIRPNQRKD